MSCNSKQSLMVDYLILIDSLRDFLSIYVISYILIRSCLILLISISKLDVTFSATFFTQLNTALLIWPRQVKCPKTQFCRRITHLCSCIPSPHLELTSTCPLCHHRTLCLLSWVCIWFASFDRGICVLIEGSDGGGIVLSILLVTRYYGLGTWWAASAVTHWWNVHIWSVCYPFQLTSLSGIRI
jgi:hypothetical protein